MVVAVVVLALCVTGMAGYGMWVGHQSTREMAGYTQAIIEGMEEFTKRVTDDLMVGNRRGIEAIGDAVAKIVQPPVYQLTADGDAREAERLSATPYPEFDPLGKDNDSDPTDFTIPDPGREMVGALKPGEGIPGILGFPGKPNTGAELWNPEDDPHFGGGEG